MTNLYNQIQPLIRYEIADRFVAGQSHGFLRATVAGRADEVLVFGNATLHPIVIRSALVKNREILDYQVQQTHRGLDVATVCAVDVETSQVVSELSLAMAAAGLSHLEVSVRQVDSLPRHLNTGKLRRFLPLA